MEPNDSYGGLSAIKIPIENEDQEVQWETVIEVDRIEELLLQRNRKHYGQARGTPFTVGALKEVVGEAGTNDATKS